MNKRKISVIILTAILTLLVFVVFVMPVSAATASAPGPAVGLNVTINETEGIWARKPNDVNFTIEFSTGNTTDLDNITWFINITTVDVANVTITPDAANLTIIDDTGLNASFSANTTHINTSGFHTSLGAVNFTFEINGTGDAVFNVNVSNSANSSEYANLTGFIFDGTAPTVTINSTAPDLTNVSPIPMTAIFTEAVIGFELAEIVVTNGDAANLTTADNITFTFDVTPTADGVVTVNIAAGVATDTATNANTAAPTFTITYDGTAPTVTISSSKGTSTFSTSTVISGTVIETNLDTLTFNGASITPAASYSREVSLSIGYNTFTVVATDLAGNSVTQTITVKRLLAGAVPTPPVEPPVEPPVIPPPVEPPVEPPVIPPPPVEPPVEPEPPIPGFGAIFAILGLLAVGYLLRRREE